MISGIKINVNVAVNFLKISKRNARRYSEKLHTLNEISKRGKQINLSYKFFSIEKKYFNSILNIIM